MCYPENVLKILNRIIVFDTYFVFMVQILENIIKTLFNVSNKMYRHLRMLFYFSCMNYFLHAKQIMISNILFYF